MSISDHILDRLRTEWPLPAIDEDKCLHGITPVAKCDRCVELCPTNAWALDEEGLFLDTKACDGCAICIAHCPQQAFGDEGLEIPTAKWRGRSLVLLACDQSSLDDQSVNISCKYAINLHQILDFYSKGITEYYLYTGQCHQCLREKNTAISPDDQIKQLNKILKNNGLKTIRWLYPDKNTWRQLQAKAIRQVDSNQSIQTSRRNFLSAALQKGVEKVEKNKPQKKTIGEILAFFGLKGVRPWVPEIDENNCNGCDACINLCPQGALSYNEKESRYQIDADSCTGCNLCIDLCDQNAVTIIEWLRPEQTEIKLYQGQCSDCGTSYHGLNKTSRCRICEQKRQMNNLYQVI